MSHFPFPMIGIMQGRLSPPRKNRIQSFPRNTWQGEFQKAREIGFDLIEFVFDEEEPETHPLMTETGIKEILQCTKETGVRSLSICADYFMFHPLHRGTPEDRGRGLSVLQKLISNAHRLGMKDIVLPAVDQATLASAEEERSLQEVLREVHPLLEKSGVRIALESDLPPPRLKRFVEELCLKSVKINYDTGNSAGLGYRPGEELSSYGEFISSVHIKDRKLHGTTVPLGTGDTDFSGFFGKLKKIGYQGSFIIQGARDGDEVRTCSRYLQFAKKWISG